MGLVHSQAPEPVQDDHHVCVVEQNKRGREESNLHRAASKTADLPLVNTRECHVGVEPTSPGWRPGTFAARPMAHSSNARRKERELNSQGFNARSASNGVPSPIGLPFHKKAPAAGIEPASGRLTVAFPYQHRTHRNMFHNSQDGRI